MPDPIRLREIDLEEALDALYPLASYAFRPSPPLHDREEWMEVVRQREGVRYFAVYEDDDPVACVAASPMSQNVRGVIYGMGGLWGVVTHPAARRKGYSKRLLKCLLAKVRQDGRAFSCLYPFRESFYERLGYVGFPKQRLAKFKPQALLPLLQGDPPGEIELASFQEVHEGYREYTQALQQCVHGMALFDHPDLGRVERTKMWQAAAKVGGELVGVMHYSLKGEEVVKFKLSAWRFYYEDSRGKYLLLAWIARHIDQAAEIELFLPPYEYPETWCADLEMSVETVERAPMGRVIDVAQVGGMQVGEGGFTVQVNDPFCEWNEGAWTFEAVDGKLQVRAGGEPQCALSIQGLSALVYGTHDPGDFAHRGWGDPSPRVQRAMNALFPRRVPYVHEWF